MKMDLDLLVAVARSWLGVKALSDELKLTGANAKIPTELPHLLRRKEEKGLRLKKMRNVAKLKMEVEKRRPQAFYRRVSPVLFQAQPCQEVRAQFPVRHRLELSAPRVVVLREVLVPSLALNLAHRRREVHNHGVEDQ